MVFTVRVTICNELKLICSLHEAFTIKEAIIHMLHSISLHQRSLNNSSPSIEQQQQHNDDSSSTSSSHPLYSLLKQLNNVDDEKVISQFALYDSPPLLANNNNDCDGSFQFNNFDLVRDVLQVNQHIYLELRRPAATTTTTTSTSTSASSSPAIACTSNGMRNDDYYPIAQYSRQNISHILKQSLLCEFDESERRVRTELAACYRLFDMFGWTDTIYGHLTARVPLVNPSEQQESSSQHHVLINPFGLLYSEITASSLVKIDLKGETIHKGCTGDLFGINRAGYVIHSALHEARLKDITCVMHCHFAPASAVSCLTKGMITELSQTHQILGGISYHDYEGIAVDEAECARLAADMGPDNKVLILKNHGVVTCGRTIGEAFLLMFTVAEAAKIQVNALSAAHTSHDLTLATAEVAQKTKHISSNFNREGFGIRELCAYMRKLDSIDPSYRL